MMVAKRWAMTSMVTPLKHSLMVAVIFASVLPSQHLTDSLSLLQQTRRAEARLTRSRPTKWLTVSWILGQSSLPSSITNTLDCFSSARAKHMSCLWPWLKLAPSENQLTSSFLDNGVPVEHIPAATKVSRSANWFFGSSSSRCTRLSASYTS